MNHEIVLLCMYVLYFYNLNNNHWRASQKLSASIPVQLTHYSNPSLLLNNNKKYNSDLH